MSRYDELLAQRAAIEEELAQLKEQDLANAIATIKSHVGNAVDAAHLLMKSFGLSESDIFKSARVRAVVQDPSVLKPMYRNPSTGETWAGRGRRPGWMNTRPEHEFLIDAPTQQEPTIIEKLANCRSQQQEPNTPVLVDWSAGNQSGSIAVAVDNPFPVQA